MDRRVSWKEYAVSTVLILAVLLIFFLIKMYVIPAPEGWDLLVIDLRAFVFSIAVGAAAIVALLLAKKPIILFAVAAAAAFISLLCSGALFTSLYAFAALCSVGSIPFAASLLAKAKKGPAV